MQNRRCSHKRAYTAAVSGNALDFDPKLIFRLTDEARIHEDSRKPVLRAMRAAWYTELTECQRRYLLHYYQDVMTMHAIAERYGVHVSTVSRTLKRARQRLRRLLQFYI